MSIYATLWSLKFPKFGQDYFGCEWVEVIAQGVPPHIGSPSPGCGYEDGDPYSSFLPPAVETNEEDEAVHLRAVVFVTRAAKKGTEQNAQEYVNPLLVLTGEEYANITFDELHSRICEALRGDHPRLMAQVALPTGEWIVLYEDGTETDVKIAEDR